MSKRLIALLTVLVLVVAACGGGDDAGDASGDDGSAETTTTASSGDGGSGEPSAETTTTAASSGASGNGSATLVVGDQTYEFDNYYCFQGSANTGNDRVSFSSGALGEIDGVRVQLDASIQDTNEGDAMDGAGTIQSVSLNDIEDFENPSVSWAAVTGFIGDPAWVIEYDGSTVHAEALFDDGRTDELEEIPGTLDATCP